MKIQIEANGNKIIFELNGSYSPNNGLYELGKVKSGSGYMAGISGEMIISRIVEE